MIEAKVSTTQERHPDLRKMISYQDGHFEHYEKINESAPRPFFPPPDIDDGLN